MMHTAAPTTAANWSRVVLNAPHEYVVKPSGKMPGGWYTVGIGSSSNISAGMATARPIVAVSCTMRFFFSRLRKISNHRTKPSPVDAPTHVIPAVHSGHPSIETRW